MPKQNPYLIKENYKKTETVQELKDEYKIPTFEEFMKTYESDGNLNYDDLNGGSVGEAIRIWTDAKTLSWCCRFSWRFLI